MIYDVYTLAAKDGAWVNEVFKRYSRWHEPWQI